MITVAGLVAGRLDERTLTDQLMRAAGRSARRKGWSSARVHVMRTGQVVEVFLRQTHHPDRGLESSKVRRRARSWR